MKSEIVSVISFRRTVTLSADIRNDIRSGGFYRPAAAVMLCAACDAEEASKPGQAATIATEAATEAVVSAAHTLYFKDSGKNDATWRSYLKAKTFDADAPFLYFYTGPEGLDTDPHVTEMNRRLKEPGYPAEKLALHFNENGTHEALLWRSVFSEFLTAMTEQRVQPLS